MPVSFNSIPQNWRMPLYWVEVDPSMAGYPRSRLTSLLIGTMNDDGTALPDVPIPVPSQADARKLFGYGSMLDGMVEYFTKNNYAQELWVVPIAEAAAGVAASGTITVATVSTSAGTLPVYIAGRRVQVFVAAGEAVDETATKIADAITADLSMPVTAVAAAGAVTLTAKWKGVEGNDIDVRMAYGGLLAAEQVPVGLTITLSGNKLTGGTGSPDITQALTNLGDEIYEYVATGFTDSTSLALLEAEYGFGDDGRWGWMRQLYGHVFAARTGAIAGGDQTGYSDLLEYGPNNNSGVLSVMGVEHHSPTPAWCWASAYTAKAARALLNDPARPLQTLVLEGCLPAPKHQRFTMKQCNDLSGVGIATQGVNADGIPAIKRESTTYQKNLYNQGDDAYELVPTLATLAALFRRQRHAITSKYPRHKLADDGTRFGAGQAIVTPKVIKAELIAQYRADEFIGLVENAVAFKQNLIVERAPDDPNRINVLYPPDLINQLRIFAVLAQFRLQYNRGVDTAIAV
ncbi:phage tail sheath C-terminal domain-containing protein [Bradyrhizobium japonicum]|uniref:phage tail sheath C-terminal domain-containing protein n=1 Tax=Bradyrhizobium japonicum TaxID=375 RepID=UPI001E406DFD|nr:phage tail sheath C-terminal domain-containing protein [Bradyrhizobium japonicum]MCD9821199.1 phage tail sheath subtilisin-like domain-containing protein [Bradyrhizobium japonicum]MEB2674105.1 phage tail sheath C-terminal domain-containing protein [Bradyrhizobium japonicum]WRI93292.1 phage tail sheath C-terminal domain-containing protein [Bradyrhizobium japonicum]